jgi:DNA-binding response OmpR family regulator
MRILIAEDDLTSRTILVSVLEHAGHQVVETIDGADAWRALQQADAPRLVILDWMMPEMDGLEVLRLIRTLPTACPPYVIMLTAKGEVTDIVAALNAGGNDYLTKPAEPSEILARVEVGQRAIELELRQHRLQTYLQTLRAESSRRIEELQNALASKTDELRRTQAELRALAARL